MGILSSHLHLLAMERAKHPIRGDVLTLGQQAVYGTLEEAKNIFKSRNIALKDLKEGFDTKNRIPCWIGTPRDKFTNAHAVLAMLGAESVSAADIADYENPDYPMDLNYNVGEQYREQFDVILDTGTLEHIFDIPTALGNIVKMLKKGGEVILMAPSSGAIDHGFYSLSPALFFDFFTANGFSNFSCYLSVGSNFNYMKRSKIYRYNYTGGEYPLASRNNVDVCFFATKNKNADSEKINKPIQNVYASFYWDKDKYGKGASSRASRSKDFLRKLEFYTARFRPELVDIFWKGRKRRRNLTYIGRF